MLKTQTDFERAMACLGADLDVFDFYRMDEPHGYGMTQCPQCSQQADLHRKPEGVLMVCTKCPMEAEWTCTAQETPFGGAGKIKLIRMDLGEAA